MMAQVKFDITFGRLVVGRSPPPRPLHMVVTGGNRIGTLALICDSSPHPTDAMPPKSNEQKLRPNRPRGSGCHQWEWRETLHRPTCERIEVRYQLSGWSGWRDSNPRSRAPKARALPTRPHPDDFEREYRRILDVLAFETGPLPLVSHMLRVSETPQQAANDAANLFRHDPFY